MHWNGRGSETRRPSPELQRTMSGRAWQIPPLRPAGFAAGKVAVVVHQRQHQRQHGQPIAPLQAPKWHGAIVDWGVQLSAVTNERAITQRTMAPKRPPLVRRPSGTVSPACGSAAASKARIKPTPSTQLASTVYTMGSPRAVPSTPCTHCAPMRAERAQQQFGRVGQVAADIPGGIGVDGIAVFLDGANQLFRR